MVFLENVIPSMQALGSLSGFSRFIKPDYRTIMGGRSRKRTALMYRPLYKALFELFAYKNNSRNAVSSRRGHFFCFPLRGVQLRLPWITVRFSWIVLLSVVCSVRTYKIEWLYFVQGHLVLTKSKDMRWRSWIMKWMNGRSPAIV